MPTPDLESLTAGLFEQCDELLGDTVVITPPGGSPLEIKLNAALGETVRDFGNSSSIVQDMQFDVDIAKVPGRPDSTWRVTLPRVVGIYSPRDVKLDDSGYRWLFGLKDMTNA